ncbi:MAG: hypothetical protein WCX48_10725, partial [Bacteroidales bacterium]
MKIKNTLMTIIILSMFNICSITIVLCQDNFYYVPSTVNGYFFSPQNLGLPNPQVADFAQYGNININKYNGLIDLEIKLEGYKDNDFDIPISIKYLSKGFIPFKRPSPVGLNWFLNCGGVITRVVNGSPDDTRGFYSQTMDPDHDKYMLDGLLVAIRDNTFETYTENNLWNFNVDLGSNNPYTIKDFNYDFEPDIFTYNFNNYSGSFIISNSGDPVMISENGCIIDIDSLSVQSYSTSAVPVNSKIKITTPEGYIYRFGGNASFIEWYIPNNPLYCKVVPRHITSWFLESIEAPNNRKATFSYASVMQKNMYNFLMYSHFITNTQAIVPAGPPNYTEGTRDKYFAMEDKVYTPIIDKITID